LLLSDNCYLKHGDYLFGAKISFFEWLEGFCVE